MTLIERGKVQSGGIVFSEPLALLAVENDLLDQYVRGRLTADEHEQFAHYLAKLPDGRHKLATATALMKVAEEEQEAAVFAQETPVPSSWWQSLLRLAPDSQPSSGTCSRLSFS